MVSKRWSKMMLGSLYHHDDHVRWADKPATVMSIPAAGSAKRAAAAAVVCLRLSSRSARPAFSSAVGDVAGSAGSISGSAVSSLISGCQARYARKGPNAAREKGGAARVGVAGGGEGG